MKILLAGDYAKDVFVYGDTLRLSPEGPYPVFSPLSSGSNAGMAGNVEANLRSLAPDAQVTVLFPEATTTKTRYVDRKSNYHLLRVDEDSKSPPLSAARFIDALEETKPDAVVFSDYAKGFLNADNMGAALLLCENRGIPTFVDTKLLLSDWSKPATVIKINAKEYAAQLAANIKSPWDHCGNLIVTQGGDGMVLLGTDGSERYRTKREETRVRDVVGAGDTTLAALVIGYLEQRDLYRAMDFAAMTSTIAVSKPGVVAVKREEVGPLKEKIALISGCFDGVHIGHLYLLTEAAKLGRLIVCLNRDSYLARKGPGRPLNVEADRVRALYATGLVHHVRVIGDSPIDEIMEIKPDFICVGRNDYTPEQVVGYKECREWGGQIVIIPLDLGVSTTQLVQAKLATS